MDNIDLEQMITDKMLQALSMANIAIKQMIRDKMYLVCLEIDNSLDVESERRKLYSLLESLRAGQEVDAFDLEAAANAVIAETSFTAYYLGLRDAAHLSDIHKAIIKEWGQSILSDSGQAPTDHGSDTHTPSFQHIGGYEGQS